MRVVVIYKADTDYARTVIDYLRDLKHQTGHEVEQIDPDTSDGAQFCRIYDIVEYPSIAAIGMDGALQSLWRGLPLPTFSEVGYYAALE